MSKYTKLEQLSKDYKNEVESNVIAMLDEVAFALEECCLDEEEEAENKRKLREEFENTSCLDLVERFNYEEQDIVEYLVDTYNISF